MTALTGYHLRFEELSRELIDHGWGELTFRVSSLKDNRVRIEILCGKFEHFFIQKKIKYGDEGAL